MNEYLRLGAYSFSIDREESVVEIKGNHIVDLTVKASEDDFDNFSEDDNFEFSWALYAPMFYARELGLDKQGRIVINDDNLHEYEVALYLMEHDDVNVSITVDDEWIKVEGSAEVDGDEYPLEICVRR